MTINDPKEPKDCDNPKVTNCIVILYSKNERENHE